MPETHVVLHRQRILNEISLNLYCDVLSVTFLNVQAAFVKRGHHSSLREDV